MPEPCRSCPRKTVDFGGCRCQAFLIAGDAGVTDPVCSLSPHRHLVDDAVAEVERTAAVDAGEWLYRAAPNSRALAAKGGSRHTPSARTSRRSARWTTSASMWA